MKGDSTEHSQVSTEPGWSHNVQDGRLPKLSYATTEVYLFMNIAHI